MASEEAGPQPNTVMKASDIFAKDFVVESVLDHLDTDDLFTCAEVNRLWQNVALSLLRKKLVSVSVCCAPESDVMPPSSSLGGSHTCVGVFCTKFARFRNLARLATMRPSLVFVSYHADLNEDKRAVETLRQLLPPDSVIVYFKLELIRPIDDSDDSPHEGIFGEFLFEIDTGAIASGPVTQGQDSQKPQDVRAPVSAAEMEEDEKKEEEQMEEQEEEQEEQQEEKLSSCSPICSCSFVFSSSYTISATNLVALSAAAEMENVTSSRNRLSLPSGPRPEQRVGDGLPVPSGPIPIPQPNLQAHPLALASLVQAVAPRRRIPSGVLGSDGGAVFQNVLPGVLVFQALHVTESTLEGNAVTSFFTENDTGRTIQVTSAAILSNMTSTRLQPFMLNLSRSFGPTTNTIAVAFPRNQDEAMPELEAFERSFPTVPALANQATEFNVDGQFAPISRLKLILLLIKLLD
ncbi:uncharacterized protein LOC144142716 [Haemaphysalis longicornis]